MAETKEFSPEHGGPPQDARDAVRARLEVERASELEYVRVAMKLLYDVRACFQPDAYVNADDAARCYDQGLERGSVRQVNRAFLGQVFKEPGWVKLNLMVKSRQPKNHARLLHCWQWRP